MSAEKEITEFINNFKKIFKRSTTVPEMRKLGNETARIIRVRTRLGYSVKEDGQSRKTLDELDDGYIKTRKKLKKLGILSKDTRPRKSNLTLTGQLLDSLKTKKASKGRVIVGPSGIRSGETLTNEKLSEYVSKRRPYLNLSRLEIKQIGLFFQREIVKPKLPRV